VKPVSHWGQSERGKPKRVIELRAKGTDLITITVGSHTGEKNSNYLCGLK